MKIIMIFLTLLLVHAPSLAKPSVNKNPLTITSVKASKPDLRPGENTAVIISFNLAKGFHAYLDKFEVSSPSHPKILFARTELKNIVEWYDKFSLENRKGAGAGQSKIHVIMELPEDISLNEHQIVLELTYQACSNDYCLFPKKATSTLHINSGSSTKEPSALSSSDEKESTSLLSVKYFKKMTKSESVIFLFFLAFLAGILTSFTPCIFPMIPITLAILGTKQKDTTPLKSFLLSLSYVFGIAFTYSILGVFAAYSGALFGSYLQHPIVISFIVLIFILMALSMFGLFSLEPPAFISNKLSSVKTKGNFIGAFVAGTIAGIVASPCVGPILVFILTYVAQSQDLFQGFFLLFFYALGLGQIFLVLGAFSHMLNKLPKSGSWMNATKYIFGSIMLAMAFYYAYPVVKKYLPQTLKQTQSDIPWEKFTAERLKSAQNQSKIIIVDFFADWCSACKELEASTFTQTPVTKLHPQIIWLKFDATNDSEALSKHRKTYGIIGLPHITIYDTKGKYRKELTLTGYENAEDFSERLKKAL